MRRTTLAATLALIACSKRSPPRDDTAEVIEQRSVACERSAGLVTCTLHSDAAKALAASGTPHGTPVQIPFPEPVVDLELSPLGSHACAVGSSGRVFCWGDDPRGQVTTQATGTAVFPPIAVPGISDATMVALNGGASCALSGAGAVACWGALASVPDAEPGRVVPLPLHRVHAIAAELVQFCALTGDGARCWGGRVPDRGRQVTTDGFRLVRDTRGAVTLRAEIGRMCAVWTDGNERCWSTTAMPLSP